jgi:ribosomal protein S18 acetylase RimI-like enzyme
MTNTRIAPALTLLGADEVDRLRPLWESMLDAYGTSAPQLSLRPADASWRRRRATYLELLSTPGGFVLALEREHELIAYAAVRPVEVSAAFGHAERAAEIETLVVAESERGSGAGASLLREVRARLRARGVDELRLHVLAGNERAIDFYRREGFSTYLLLLSDAIPPESTGTEAR